MQTTQIIQDSVNKQKIALLLAYDYARNRYMKLGEESIRVGPRSDKFNELFIEEERALYIAKILEIRLGYSKASEKEEHFAGQHREDATMIQQGFYKRLCR